MTELSSETVVTEFNDSIRIFRTDRLTTKGCGNKQFKLTSNLLELKRSGATRVLSFGGLWSNHLHAFAIACELLGLSAVAIVRGEPLRDSTLLNDAMSHGLKVRYVSRSDYRRRHDDSYIKELTQDLHCDACLPEGGSNDLAVKSCAEIASLVNSYTNASSIALSVGTGATMAGIVNGALAGQKILGVPVVQDTRLRSCIEGWIDESASAEWCLLEPAELSRYGKVDQALLEFVLQSYHDTGVILDPVYNAKALRSLLKFLPRSGLADSVHDCVFIHTGGLGGCLGFADALMSIDAQLAGRLLSEVSKLLELAENQ